MTSPLGKLTVLLGLDARQFTGGLDTAKGSMAGFGGTTKAAMGLIGGAAALGFGVVTKYAMESERAQGDFMAATGSSREEAKAFAQDMNGLVGSNGAVGKSFEEIAGFGTKVAQQFQLTGKEGTKLTDQFLGFAKVTGQGAEVVDDFDAALDAFGEPAERAAGLMDQLVASHQKYGTDAGPDALKTLQGMAPALSAMGLGLDDGVGLLNLFESAGLDASGAQKALNAAVANLPPGENINDVIQRLAAIEDPAERAQAAMEVFGTKAGVGMANAIKPGMTGLDEFVVTAEDAADRTNKASEDMVDTAGKIRQAWDKAGAVLRGFGTDVGPAITGLASLGSAFGSFLSTDLGGKLIDSFKGVWGKVAASAPVKFAVGAAGAAAGAIYAVASAAAEKLVGAISGVWGKVGSSSAVKAAATAAGTSAGGAMGLAATAAFGLVLADLATKLPQFGEDARDTFDALRRKDIPAAKDAFQGFIDLLKSNPFTQPSSIVSQWGLDSVPDEMADVGAEGAAALSGAFWDGFEAETAGSTVAQHFTQRVGDGIDEGLANLNLAPFSETRAYAELIADAGELGASIPGQIGSSIQSHANEVLDGVASLRDLLENGLSPRARALQLIGSDYISLIRQGMDSNIDGAVESARSVAAAAINTLEEGGLNGVNGERSLRQVGKLFDELIGSGMSGEAALELLRTAGVTADSAVLEGVRSKYPQFFTTGEGAAQKTISGWKNGKWYDAGFTATSNIREGIKAYSWYTGGWNTAKAWIGGFADKFDAFNWANLINSTVGPYTSGQSPPKKGPLHNIDKWGFNVGKAWIDGFGGALASIGGVMPRGGLALATARVASLGVNAPGLAMAGGSGGDLHVHIHGDVYGGPSGLYELGRKIDDQMRFHTRAGQLDRRRG